MLRILTGVESYLTNNKPSVDSAAELNNWNVKVRAVLQAQQYIRGKGAMSKMLMESVALVI